MKATQTLMFRTILLACLWSGAAWSASPPDLSGFWMLDFRPGATDPGLMAKVKPGTAFLADTGAAEFGPMEFGGLKLKPEAMEAARSWKIADDMTVQNSCRIPSIVYAMQGPFPIEIFQGTEMIVMRLEYFDMARVIFLNRKEHLPPNAPHTKTGDSIGHWDGDTLVVDTTHLKEATITNNGLNHSTKIHVIERFKLSPDGKQLLATQEFEDPETLENRGVRFITWSRVAGDHVHAYDCDPSFGEAYAEK